MLEQVCAHIHNYFISAVYPARYSIESGMISPAPSLKEGQRFWLCGGQLMQVFPHCHIVWIHFVTSSVRIAFRQMRFYFFASVKNLVKRIIRRLSAYTVRANLCQVRAMFG